MATLGSNPDYQYQFKLLRDELEELEMNKAKKKQAGLTIGKNLIDIYSGTQNLKTKELDIKKLNNLNFQKVNYKKFPLVKILSKLPKSDSLFETVIVTANDEFVKLYLNKKISYNDLIDKIYKFIHLPEFAKYKLIKPKKIDTIQNLNSYVRLKIENLSV